MVNVMFNWVVKWSLFVTFLYLTALYIKNAFVFAMFSYILINTILNPMTFIVKNRASKLMAKELTTQSYIEHHLTNLTCGKQSMVVGRVTSYDVENGLFGLSMWTLCFGLFF